MPCFTRGHETPSPARKLSWRDSPVGAAYAVDDHVVECAADLAALKVGGTPGEAHPVARPSVPARLKVNRLRNVVRRLVRLERRRLFKEPVVGFGVPPLAQAQIQHHRVPLRTPDPQPSRLVQGGRGGVTTGITKASPARSREPYPLSLHRTSPRPGATPRPPTLPTRPALHQPGLPM